MMELAARLDAESLRLELPAEMEDLYHQNHADAAVLVPGVRAEGDDVEDPLLEPAQAQLESAKMGVWVSRSRLLTLLLAAALLSLGLALCVTRRPEAREHARLTEASEEPLSLFDKAIKQLEDEGWNLQRHLSEEDPPEVSANFAPGELAAAVFETMDRNEDGHLDLFEWNAQAPVPNAGARELFEAPALKGRLHAEGWIEPRRLPDSTPAPDGTFMRIDADHDGMVSRKEWDAQPEDVVLGWAPNPSREKEKKAELPTVSPNQIPVSREVDLAQCTISAATIAAKAARVSLHIENAVFFCPTQNVSKSQQLQCVAPVAGSQQAFYSLISLVTDTLAFCPTKGIGGDVTRCVGDFFTMASGAARSANAGSTLEFACSPTSTATRTTSTTIPIGPTRTSTTATTSTPDWDEPETWDVNAIVNLLRTSTSTLPTRSPDRQVLANGLCVVQAFQATLFLAKASLLIRAATRDCVTQNTNTERVTCLVDMASLLSAIGLVGNYVSSCVTSCTSSVYRDAQCSQGVNSIVAALMSMTRGGAAASLHCKNAAKSLAGFDVGW